MQPLINESWSDCLESQRSEKGVFINSEHSPVAPASHAKLHFWTLQAKFPAKKRRDLRKQVEICID